MDKAQTTNGCLGLLHYSGEIERFDDGRLAATTGLGGSAEPKTKLECAISGHLW